MSNIRRWASAGAVLALVAARGSQSRTALHANGEPATAGAERERGFAQFPDIPIPSAATMDLDRSLVQGARDAWVGRLAMHVGGGPGALYDFYSREMVRFGWREITSVRSETSVLTYDRGDRVALVQIWRNALRGARVDVTISPRGRQRAPRADLSVAPLR